MGRLLLAAFPVAVILLLAGCGAAPERRNGDTSARVQPDDPLVGVYRADAVPAGPFDEVAGRYQLQLTLMEGELRFRGDCNHFFGEGSWTDGRFRTGSMGGTEMGCSPEAMARDAWLVDFFATADRLERTSSGVSIHRGEDAIRFDRTGDVPEPAASPDEATFSSAG
jgi:heat shock protein HslJ